MRIAESHLRRMIRDVLICEAASPDAFFSLVLGTDPDRAGGSENERHIRKIRVVKMIKDDSLTFATVSSLANIIVKNQLFKPDDPSGWLGAIESEWSEYLPDQIGQLIKELRALGIAADTRSQDESGPGPKTLQIVLDNLRLAQMRFELLKEHMLALSRAAIKIRRSSGSIQDARLESYDPMTGTIAVTWLEQSDRQYRYKSASLNDPDFLEANKHTSAGSVMEKIRRMGTCWVNVPRSRGGSTPGGIILKVDEFQGGQGFETQVAFSMDPSARLFVTSEGEVHYGREQMGSKWFGTADRSIYNLIDANPKLTTSFFN